jgi:hypothetical protein
MPTRLDIRYWGLQDCVDIRVQFTVWQYINVPQFQVTALL